MTKTHSSTRSQWLYSATVLATGLVMTGSLLNSPGTADKEFYFEWANNFISLGPSDGYAASLDYPPFTMFVLGNAFYALLDIVGSEIWVLRVLNLFALCVSAILFGLISKRSSTAAMYWGFAVVGAIGMLGNDVWFAPFLIASLWALQKKNLILSTVLFSVATLVKWQPVVLIPFLLVYSWKILEGDLRTRLAQFFLRVAMPPSVIFVLTGVVFGFENLARAFLGNLSSWVLSGNATNFNWIITWALRQFSPDTYGPLEGGLIRYLPLEDGSMGVGRVIFWIIFLFLLYQLAREPADFSRTVLFGALAFFAYFVFNVGVHANHLFVVGLLFLFLAQSGGGSIKLFATVAVLHNANLLLMYGFSAQYNVERVVLGVDLSLLLAIFHVIFFLWVLAQVLRSEDPIFGTKRAKRAEPEDNNPLD